jgi:hypothetical protein
MHPPLSGQLIRFRMPSQNSQTDSQPVHQDNEHNGALQSFNDSDLQLLVRFIELLDEWDRPSNLNIPFEEPTTLEHH